MKLERRGKLLIHLRKINLHTINQNLQSNIFKIKIKKKNLLILNKKELI